jgi:hypothetical protein
LPVQRQHVTAEKLFLLAKDALAAKHICDRVKKGSLNKEKTFFKTDHEAIRARSHMPRQQQPNLSVFQINYITREAL